MRYLKSIKTVTTAAGIVLAILTIPIQLSSQNGQVRHSSDKTQPPASKPLNQTPQTRDDMLCVASALNSTGVKSQTTPTTPVQQHRVNLSWKASISPGVVKYNVYRCARGGTCSVIASVASTIYTDSQVQALRTYCYFVTAATASGPDSGASNFVQVVIPSP
jgi:fibronectin type 3 domain-containing protein